MCRDTSSSSYSGARQLDFRGLDASVVVEHGHGRIVARGAADLGPGDLQAVPGLGRRR
jgi:hypothetical protein